MKPIGTLEVEHQSMVVVYDSRTGRIIHTHQAQNSFNCTVL